MQVLIIEYMCGYLFMRSTHLILSYERMLKSEFEIVELVIYFLNWLNFLIEVK